MKKSLILLASFVLLLSGVWCLDPDSAPLVPNEVVVTNTKEFLAAIAPHTTIILDLAADEAISFTDEYPEDQSPYYRFENVYDGKQLLIQNLEGLSIMGLEDRYATILSHHPFANVIWFHNCSDLDLRWLSCGHEVPGFCTGGVLVFEECHNVTISNCDLWGCGAEGLYVTYCSGFVCKDTTIRDCTYGIMSVFNSRDVRFEDCRMHDNQELDLFNIKNSELVRFSDCAIWNNICRGMYDSKYLVNASDSQVTFERCDIFANRVEALTNDDAISFVDCMMADNLPYREED